MAHFCPACLVRRPGAWLACCMGMHLGNCLKPCSAGFQLFSPCSTKPAYCMFVPVLPYTAQLLLTNVYQAGNFEYSYRLSPNFHFPPKIQNFVNRVATQTDFVYTFVEQAQLPWVHLQSHCLKTKKRFIKRKRLPSHIHILRTWSGLFSIVNTYFLLKDKFRAPSIIIIQKSFQGHQTAD